MLRNFSMIALGVVLVAGCDEKKSEPTPPPPVPAAAPTPAAAPSAAAPAAAAAPAGGKGDVKGTVTITGKAPEMADLKRTTDPFCGKTKMKDEEVVATKDGKLANVLIHINGAPAAEAPKDTATIAQENCMYRPRVQGVVAGQTVAIKNGDPTLHNVHTYKGTSTLFNQAQVPNTPSIEKKFTDNGAMLKFKCDVHQWMTGYVWVQNNPYFAVSGADGTFSIKGVPAGKYEVEAWHERFGTKKGEVTVVDGKPAEVKFEFTGSETATAK